MSRKRLAYSWLVIGIIAAALVLALVAALVRGAAAGPLAIAALAVQNGGGESMLRDLLRRAWVKSWYWMPELEPRVNAALEV